MAGGAYTALSGLRARVEQLDRLAGDIANVGTAGYKAERTTSVAADRPNFGAVLQSAIDVAPGPGRVDFKPGTIEPTGRDLDFALDGPGFFVLETPQGLRYTRNGQFARQSDGTLTSLDGSPVLGEGGPIVLGKGAISIDSKGVIRAGGVAAGKPRVVDFPDYSALGRESGGRFRAPEGMTPTTPADTTVLNGSLEHSNVSLVDRIAQLTEVARGFEALQRGITILVNEVDGRAITELGRR